MKLYIPINQSQPAKVIPLMASALDEWIPLEEAAKLFKSKSHPEGIDPQTLKNRVWVKSGPRKLPAGSYTWGPSGLWFHKPTLMGLKRITDFNTAA